MLQWQKKKKSTGVNARPACNSCLISVITVVIIDGQHVFIHFSQQ